MSRGSLSGGLCPGGGSVWGGLCPGGWGSLCRRSLSGGSLSRGDSLSGRPPPVDRHL